MDEKITLNDGTVLENSHCVQANGRLFVYCRNMDLKTGYALFIDPEKTKKITMERYGLTTVYEGYSELYSISMDEDSCNMALK